MFLFTSSLFNDFLLYLSYLFSIQTFIYSFTHSINPANTALPQNAFLSASSVTFGEVIYRLETAIICPYGTLTMLVPGQSGTMFLGKSTHERKIFIRSF